MKKLTIAIDGPVGSGKSSVARRVAELLGYVYLDSAAMYRALAWKALERGVPLESERELEALARATRIDLETMRVRVDGADVTEKIRTAAASQAASKLAAIAAVRPVLVSQQQRPRPDRRLVID